jgi:hypothetical protein
METIGRAEAQKVASTLSLPTEVDLRSHYGGVIGL